MPTNEDTWLDTWLDAHPRIDRAYTLVYIRVERRVRQALDFSGRRERARWKPGTFYLDHGSEPCCLVSRKDDLLTGVSLVDGRLIGGCSIYACGPEMVSLHEADAIAEGMRRARRQAQREAEEE